MQKLRKFTTYESFLKKKKTKKLPKNTVQQEQDREWIQDEEVGCRTIGEQKNQENEIVKTYCKEKNKTPEINVKDHFTMSGERRWGS